nr:hypothetical protein [Tanacetum cinerariifolium]
MSNVVGKVKFLRVFEMMKHDSGACIYERFMSVDTNDIFLNDEFPILDVRRKIISKDNVILNGDSPVHEPLAVGTIVPLKTEAQKLARKNELKAKTIKITFGGNKESKKMHKTILKQQYENFVASRSKGLDKTYDSINETVIAAHDIPATGSKEQPSASSYADDGNMSADNERRVVIVETPASALVVQDRLGGYD